MPSDRSSPTSKGSDGAARRRAVPDDLQRRLDAAIGSDELVCYVGQPSWRAEFGVLLLTSGFGLGLLAISGFFAWHLAAAALGYEPFHFDAGLAAFNFDRRLAPPWLAGAFLLTVLPVVWIGAFCAMTPIGALRRSAITLHVVTNRHVLTVVGGRRGGCERHPLSQVHIHRRTDRGDGSGTLVIAYGVYRDPDGNRRPETVTWYGIPRVDLAALAITNWGGAPLQPEMPQAAARDA